MPETPTRKAESEVDDRVNFRKTPRLTTPEKTVVLLESSNNCSPPLSSLTEMDEKDKLDTIMKLIQDGNSDAKDI